MVVVQIVLSLEDLDVLTEDGAICDEDGTVGRVQVRGTRGW